MKEGLPRISQMLNVRRVVDVFIADRSDVKDDSFDRVELLILLGERIRLVKDVSLLELIGSAGGLRSFVGAVGDDNDERLVDFKCSSSLLGDESVVVSNFSSLIRRDFDLEEKRRIVFGFVLSSSITDSR